MDMCLRMCLCVYLNVLVLKCTLGVRRNTNFNCKKYFFGLA